MSIYCNKSDIQNGKKTWKDKFAVIKLKASEIKNAQNQSNIKRLTKLKKKTSQFKICVLSHNVIPGAPRNPANEIPEIVNVFESFIRHTKSFSKSEVAKAPRLTSWSDLIRSQSKCRCTQSLSILFLFFSNLIDLPLTRRRNHPKIQN